MKKGLFKVFFANIVYLILNLLINFLIPKYVSIDSYSLIKTYALYISYAGFFSIGYNDGMYLKYGGKNLEEIDKKELSDNFINYIILIFFMFILILLSSIILKDNILIAFSFGMVSYNLLSYLKSLYQATGKFGLYGICLNVEKILIFIFTFLGIYIFKSDSYLFYVWVQVIVGLLVSGYLFIIFQKNFNIFKYGKFKFTEIKENIKSGIVLMLGNFSNILFTGMDRWFVKFLLNSFSFAMYSFAASMEGIVNVFISPITITMYNYFCKKPKLEDIKNVKNLSLIYGFLIISLAFPAKFILEFYLTKYINSVNLIYFLFAAQLFYVIIKGIYVNLYKAQKRQKKYLLQLLIMLFVGFCLNFIFFKIFKNNESIAFATFITALIWFVICEISEKTYRYNAKNYISIILILIIYFTTGFMFNSIIGFMMYIISALVITSIFMNSSIKYLMQILKKAYLKIIKRKIKE